VRLLAESMAREGLIGDVQKKNEEEVLREVQAVVKMLSRKNMEKDTKLQGSGQSTTKMSSNETCLTFP